MGKLGHYPISKDDLRSHGFPENPTKEQFVSYLDREIAMANNYLIDLDRARQRVVEHIRSAPEREFAALRRANVNLVGTGED
jgi:hypothetical protein